MIMKYCYLDHNILIESLNDSSIDKAIRELKDSDILLWQLNNATYAMNLCLFLI